ncbi:MAG: ParA family protein [Acidihalobacter sp.]
MKAMENRTRIITIANQKGGVGKTTTAINLATALAAIGERVLVVDLDPQGNASTGLGIDRKNRPVSAYDVLVEDCNAVDASVETVVPNLSIIPSTFDLLGVEMEISQYADRATRLRKALREDRRLTDSFTYVLIDCPPMLGVLMVNALAACEQLLIPVQTEFLALKGLERMLRTVSMVGRSRSGELNHTIVPTMFDRRTRAAVDALRQLRGDYGERVWKGVVPIDTQFREASKSAVPLTTLRPGARGSRAYAQLLEWLEGRMTAWPMEMTHGAAV